MKFIKNKNSIHFPFEFNGPHGFSFIYFVLIFFFGVVVFDLSVADLCGVYSIFSLSVKVVLSSILCGVNLFIFGENTYLC